MAYQYQASYESFSSLLSFSTFTKGPYTTAQLASDEKDLLNRYCKDLGYDPPKVSAYKALMAMLEHAPAESGKTYVATVLHVAKTK